LARLPQLQNPDGSFSQSAYRQLLAQRQLTDADVRADIGQGLVARQLLAPAELAIGMPASIAQRYAGLLTERREGTVAVLPAALFAPKDKPADADVARFYAAHLATYNRPERRVIRYALFDDSVAKQVAAPTEAEIAQRYGANKAQYAASESRHIVQLILPGEEAAKALAAELAKGQSLEAAARARGLATAPLGPLSHDALAQQTSGAIADAVFAAKKGALVGPVKGALGYALIRVDEVVTKPARTLDQAHGEIAAQLASEKRKAAIGALTARIDDNLGHGGALSDAAKDLGLTLSATAPLTADGQVYPGAAGAPLPTALSAKEQASIVKAAFAMEHEGQPQL
ncbi:MAG TPA: peptidyl-prolyl cis-trans isomerase, partial [Novosphingobium sp.]|nr:peptidyl-prolyl cis-trans isomerase [Novosphingobium sp.]